MRNKAERRVEALYLPTDVGVYFLSIQSLGNTYFLLNKILTIYTEEMHLIVAFCDNYEYSTQFVLYTLSGVSQKKRKKQVKFGGFFTIIENTVSSNFKPGHKTITWAFYMHGSLNATRAQRGYVDFYIICLLWLDSLLLGVQAKPARKIAQVHKQVHQLSIVRSARLAERGGVGDPPTGPLG